MKWPLLLTWFLSSHSSILGAPHVGCEFPEQWRGGWFQSGADGLVAVNGSTITSKGQCIDAEGDKFLIEDQSYKCYRCIVMHEKHPNVLQYKETLCEAKRASLYDLCKELTGDATLYSLFRSGAAPSPCPFKGPLDFTYSRGQGECSSPRSLAETCTQESRLLLRYQACADVPSTESTEVELECLAAWKEGSIQYLVARLHGDRVDNDEARYRCFVYAKTAADTWSLAQSGDATCNGLDNPNEGAKTLKMRQRVVPEGCVYPSWIVSAETWVALDLVARLLVSPRNITIVDRNETRLVCHFIINTSSSNQPERQVMLVAKATRECENGYVCLVLHKRDDHVIEMQQSKRWSQQPDEACKPNVFNPLLAAYTTFITLEPISRECPHLGRYEVVSAIRFHAESEESLGTEGEQNVEEVNDVEAQEVKATSAPLSPTRRCLRGLNIGCNSRDLMEFATSCRDEALSDPGRPFSVYRCHGTWEENGTAYLVASTEAGRYCLVYSTTTTSTSTDLSVTGHLASCPRASHSHHHQHVWQVNLTAYAKCGETSSAIPWTSYSSSAIIRGLLSTLFSKYITR